MRKFLYNGYVIFFGLPILILAGIVNVLIEIGKCLKISKGTDGSFKNTAPILKLLHKCRPPFGKNNEAGGESDFRSNVKKIRVSNIIEARPAKKEGEICLNQ
jgi:hypothetical protein